MIFKVIQELKKNRLMTDKKINYAKAMSTKLYPKSLMFTIKCLGNMYLNEPEIFYKDNNSEIVVSHNNDIRKDYYEIVNGFKSIVQNYNELIICKRKCINKIGDNTIKLLKTLKKNRKLEMNFSDKLRISALEVYFRTVSQKLDLFEFKEKLYISFCDFYLEENIVAQYMKNKMKTATLQHGQYRINKNGYETADSEAYLSFVSDYLLSWGEVTVNEFVRAGISEERIISVGAIKPFSNRSIVDKTNENNCFGVILNGETYSKSNKRMLKIANEIAEAYSLKYYVRPHPMNKMKDYLKYIDKNCFLGVLNKPKEYFEIVDFSILHMTGVFVECLSKNVPFFVFDDEWTEDIFKIDNIKFKDIKEFKEKYKYKIDNMKVFLNMLNEEYLKFNCCNDYNELKANYINAIDKIIKGEDVHG